MSGNSEGGKKAARTNKRRYGSSFYINIGSKGGKKGKTGGFHYMKETDPERHRELSHVGGSRSRRGKRYIGTDENGENEHVRVI